jgi:hypothetical protein
MAATTAAATTAVFPPRPRSSSLPVSPSSAFNNVAQKSKNLALANQKNAFLQPLVAKFLPIHPRELSCYETATDFNFAICMDKVGKTFAAGFFVKEEGAFVAQRITVNGERSHMLGARLVDPFERWEIVNLTESAAYLALPSAYTAVRKDPEKQQLVDKKGESFFQRLLSGELIRAAKPYNIALDATGNATRHYVTVVKVD